MALPDWQSVAGRAGMYKKDVSSGLTAYKSWVYAKGFELIEPILKSVTLAYDSDLILPSSFDKPSQVSYFVASLGSKIDEQIASYFAQGKDLKGFLLDAWASQSVEQVLRWWDRVLRSCYGSGSIRFSPGYKGLDLLANVEIMRKFVALPQVVADEQTGVMLPRKSCVALIAWE